jgi:triosephosphate isomerase
MAKMLVAGNWKCNKLFNEAQLFVDALENALNVAFDNAGVASGKDRGCDVMVAPPSPYLAAWAQQVNGAFAVGAQHCSHVEPGAHTGDFTADMLSSCGVEMVILGHSERRADHSETDAQVAKQLRHALDAGLRPILCCGESLECRESGAHHDWIQGQITAATADLSTEEMSRIDIAYEPIWAIGTGVTASAEQAQEMHAFIRGVVGQIHGDDVAKATRILYGGSCKPSNADELFSCPDVDGGLIGGAALDPVSFAAIVVVAQLTA